MRRTISLALTAALITVGLALPAVAGGNSGVAQTHPGHQGYLASDGANIGAPPVFHFAAHGGPGYPGGPGGWGGAVSDAASTYKGLKNAHGG